MSIKIKPQVSNQNQNKLRAFKNGRLIFKLTNLLC